MWTLKLHSKNISTHISYLLDLFVPAVSFRLLLSLIYLIQKQILEIAIKTLRFIKCGFELWMREMNNLGYFMVPNGTKYVLCTKFLIQNVTKISFWGHQGRQVKTQDFGCRKSIGSWHFTNIVLCFIMFWNQKTYLFPMIV